VVPKHLLCVTGRPIYTFLLVEISVALAILGFVQNRAPDLPSGLKLVLLLGAETMLAALL